MREAQHIDYEGVPAKIFQAEHIVAIGASVDRAKDKARIEQLLQQANLDGACVPLRRGSGVLGQ